MVMISRTVLSNCERHVHGHNKQYSTEHMRMACASHSAVCVRLQANDIFMRMLSLDSMENVTARDVTRSKRLKKADALLKSFFGNSLHLLGTTFVLFKRPT